MATCPYCLSDIPENAKYCTECGKRLPLSDPTSAAMDAAISETAVPASSAGTRDRTLRLAAFGILFAILVVASALLLHSVFGRQTTILSERGAAGGENTSALTGHYTLRAYAIGERDYGSDAVASTGYDSWYLHFNGDGTGEALLFSDQPLSFQYDEQTLSFSDGSSLPYSISGETVTISGAATLIFEKENGSCTAFSSSGAQNPLWLGSTWYGTLEIRGHAGAGALKDGTQEIWGILDESQDGRVYFELYDVPDYDEDDVPVLSFWATRYEDHIEPLIGNQDAWFFDRWLTKSDVKLLTLYCQDGEIHCSYPYKNGKETCVIEFSLQPDSGA